MWSETSGERMDGVGQRLLTISQWLRQIASGLGRPPRVLDYGAGTGALLTLPLSRNCPELPIAAFDVSPRNIIRLRDLASRCAVSNLYASSRRKEIAEHAPFDVIICADVLEHLADPESVLRDIRALLSAHGRLIVSVPNGFGWFEIGTFISDLLWISGLAARARGWLRREMPLPSPPHEGAAATADTLEIDPHLQFFTRAALRRLLGRSGYSVLAWRNRMFLSGFPFHCLERWPRLVRWNARVAEKLPPAWCSGWLVLCAPSPAGASAPAPRPSRTLRAWTAMKSWSAQKRWRQEMPSHAHPDLFHSRL